MSTPKKISELPLVSDIGAAKLLVVDDTGVKQASPHHLQKAQMRIGGDLVEDFNDFITPGVYETSGVTSPKNGPKGIPTYISLLEVFQRAISGLILQRVTARDGSIATRTLESGTWSEWTILKSGGVICCTAVGPYRVTVTQKGGPHEHTGESAERKRTSCYIPERIGISGRESRVAGRIHSDGSVLHLPDLQYNGDAILAMGCSDGTEQSHDCSSILPNDWIKHIVSSLVAERLVSVGAVGRDTVHGNNLLISRKEVVVA